MSNSPRWWTRALRRRSAEEAMHTHPKPPGQPWNPRYRPEPGSWDSEEVRTLVDLLAALRALTEAKVQEPPARYTPGRWHDENLRAVASPAYLKAKRQLEKPGNDA